ncbi:hypothetical protein [uncultured Winogradskyella sp.]|uniref:hypothetical protein n=1 Tax=uncultured Winogradskyella sp. TaxID=395353 RepID=UPI002617266E|nr:hypothetical protein [uncultured Winogradskyella sp.]
MKYILFLLFLISINFYSYSQFSEPYRPTKVFLKSGDSLVGMGKTRNKAFKFRANSESKAFFIDFSKIKFIEQKNSENEWIKFKFFQTTNSDKFIRVQELNVGETLELYAIISNGNVSVAGGGSFPMTSVSYYLKKNQEEKLTKIGIYDPVFSDYTTLVKNYFSDCPKLIEQIENKTLRFRDGLEEMVKYYNSNCVED